MVSSVGFLIFTSEEYALGQYLSRMKLKESPWDDPYPWKPRNNQPNKRLPYAIVVGVADCGTRTVMSHLRLNPYAIPMSRQIHYFSQQFEKGEDFYLRQIPAVKPEYKVIEMASSYWTYTFHRSPTRIKRIYSDHDQMPRIIFVLCDPYQRTLTRYARLRVLNANRRNVISPTYNEIVTNGKGGIDKTIRTIKEALYDTYFAEWLTHFPKNQLHIMDGEVLEKDPFIEMKRLEHFLQLPDIIRKSDFVFNTTTGHFCRRERYGAPPTCMWDQSKDKVLSQLHISPSLTRQVKSFYKPHNRNFSNRMNQTFSWNLY